MINLENFFTNPIAATDASYENKRLFSEAHLGKLTAQNTANQYDTMLAAHTAFFGDVNNEAIKLAVQKTQTKLVDKIMADFTKAASQLNAYFVSTGLNELPLYDTFFPQGVQAVTRDTNKGNISSHIDVLVAAITANTTEAGGAAVLTKFTAFQTNYGTARALQTTKMGQTEGARTDRDAAEIVWEDQVNDDLLDLAKLFKRQPDKMNDFFTQHYLRPEHHEATDHKGTLGGLITRDGSTDAEGDVKVHVIDGGIDNAYSKADGKYKTQKLVTGFYMVEFSKPGFRTQTIRVEIMDDGSTELNVIMSIE